ncbi:hypothetical protein PV458_06345 [Streptomyces sp. MN03-5084-2B]|nr:hypothetical protein [Streptomyces sp. MN03-5084-2B]
MTSTAAAVVAPVVRSVLPVVEPVSRALLSPVTDAAAGLVGALSGVVEPVAGAASPVVTGLLTPAAGDAGRPVAGPVADAADASGSVVRPVLRSSAPTPAPASGPAPVAQLTTGPAVLEKAAYPVASGRRACVATSAAAGPRRGPAHHPEAGLGSHRPGNAPAHPGAPGPSSDVASGGGAGIPPAFLTAGHAPHHLRASTWTHGVFVPLWRPSEPGTGPG